ncbi:MAG: hypothetical protein ACOYEA_02250 [Fermentimonas sp.]
MNSKIRNIILLLFLLAFIATIVVYFAFDKNMKLTWYFGGAAIALYLLYRFGGKGGNNNRTTNKFNR